MSSTTTLVSKLFFLLSFICCISTMAFCMHHGLDFPTNVAHLTDLFPHLSFDKAFSDFFGGKNVQHVDNGSSINLILDKTSSSGFRSQDMYYYGFFSASIKLPADYSAGVVVAFYMSNSEVFQHNHDEIDIELLGHEKRKEWVLQTNVYGNGSVSAGREEKFYLWFDPSQQFHQYSIIWNSHHIVFLVDNIPVREVNHSDSMSIAYPSKPMTLYSTIWDGSDWATHGGKKPVSYQYAPFTATFKDLEMGGCVWNQTKTSAACSKSGQSIHLRLDPVEGEEFIKLSQQQQMGMQWARQKFMFYSYCQDSHRFSVTPPECKQS